jgi:hypothetical protein
MSRHPSESRWQGAVFGFQGSERGVQPGSRSRKDKARFQVRVHFKKEKPIAACHGNACMRACPQAVDLRVSNELSMHWSAMIQDFFN